LINVNLHLSLHLHPPDQVQDQNMIEEKIKPTHTQVKSNQEGKEKNKISSDERKTTDKSPNRKENGRKNKLAGIKIEMAQAQAQRRGGAEQEKNDNQNTTLASGNGSFVGRNRHRKSCAVVSFRFVYVKASEMAYVSSCTFFFGVRGMVMDHLEKRQSRGSR
jgi:hypothetical protein